MTFTPHSDFEITSIKYVADGSGQSIRYANVLFNWTSPEASPTNWQWAVYMGVQDNRTGTGHTGEYYYSQRQGWTDAVPSVPNRTLQVPQPLTYPSGADFTLTPDRSFTFRLASKYIQNPNNPGVPNYNPNLGVFNGWPSGPIIYDELVVDVEVPVPPALPPNTPPSGLSVTDDVLDNCSRNIEFTWTPGVYGGGYYTWDYPSQTWVLHAGSGNMPATLEVSSDPDFAIDKTASYNAGTGSTYQLDGLNPFVTYYCRILAGGDYTNTVTIDAYGPDELTQTFELTIQTDPAYGVAEGDLFLLAILAANDAGAGPPEEVASVTFPDFVFTAVANIASADRRLSLFWSPIPAAWDPQNLDTGVIDTQAAFVTVNRMFLRVPSVDPIAQAVSDYGTAGTASAPLLDFEFASNRGIAVIDTDQLLVLQISGFGPDDWQVVNGTMSWFGYGGSLQHRGFREAVFDLDPDAPSFDWRMIALEVRSA